MRTGIALGALLLIGCPGAASSGLPLALRPACDAGRYWDGATCKPRGLAAQKIAEGKAALDKLEVEEANVALAAADQGGPLDHDANVTLWEQRGLAASYIDDEPRAKSAFDMLLSLDPNHLLSYRLSTKATFRFETVRDQLKTRGAPAIDVNWQVGQRVGVPIALDIEVLADPKQFLRTATVFVRTRGEQSWRAADLALAPRSQRVVLPAITLEKPASLELYVRAYDDKRNEVLAWADPARPREIPLRYDPPTPWFKRPTTLVVGGAIAIAATAAIVYLATIAPPDKVDGMTVVQ